MESEFSDDPAYFYELEEAKERIAELQKLRRKLKNALKKLKKQKKKVRHAGMLK